MTEQKIYRLVDLVRRLDRDKSTLIRWEAEGRIPKAKRDVRGWRYYTSEDFGSIVQFVEKEINFHEKTPASEGLSLELLVPNKENIQAEPVMLVATHALEQIPAAPREHFENTYVASLQRRESSRMIFPSTASERASSLLYTVIAMFAMVFIGHFAIYTITTPPSERNRLAVLSDFFVLFSQNLAVRFTSGTEKLVLVSPDEETPRTPAPHDRIDRIDMIRARSLFPDGFVRDDRLENFFSFFGVHKISGYLDASAFGMITPAFVKKEGEKIIFASVIMFKRNEQEMPANSPMMTGALAMNEEEPPERMRVRSGLRNAFWLRKGSNIFSYLISGADSLRASGGVVWSEFAHHFDPYAKARRVVLGNKEELELLFHNAYSEARELLSGVHSVVMLGSTHYLDQGAIRQTMAEDSLLRWNHELTQGLVPTHAYTMRRFVRYEQKNSQATLLALWDGIYFSFRNEPMYPVQ